MARDSSALHLLPDDVRAKITAMARDGETPAAVTLMLRTDHGMRRTPGTVRHSTPFCDGLRLRAREASEASERARLGVEARRAAAREQHWRHRDFPSVSLPRLSILDGAQA